jgi:hypothetical protein
LPPGVPYVTEVQQLSAADARIVHVMPSPLDMALFPEPEHATATNNDAPFGVPYVTDVQLLSAADERLVQSVPGVPGGSNGILLGVGVLDFVPLRVPLGVSVFDIVPLRVPLGVPLGVGVFDIVPLGVPLGVPLSVGVFDIVPLGVGVFDIVPMKSAKGVGLATTLLTKPCGFAILKTESPKETTERRKTIMNAMFGV